LISDAVVLIRFDSFTLSSSASEIIVSPSAKQATAAITGNSSISLGMISPFITVP